MTRAIGLSACLAGLLIGAGPERSAYPGWSALPEVQPNANRTPAGRLSHDTLELRLVVAMAVWHPEAETGPSIEVAAFGEEGKAPEIPGPLIRVRAGTIISATVRNALTDSTIAVHGLATRPAAAPDSLVLRPGESRSITFAAGAPGTYFYWASLGANDHDLDDEREQLAGAFVVDPPQGSPDDRVLVVNIWGTNVDSVTYRNALTVNGRSWPHNERIQATTGDTLRWRVVNASWRNHPMHLHGFYYSVDARGDVFADTLYLAPARRLVVTEMLRPMTTMTMTWVAERPGNWLFHCHLAFHVVPSARLHPPARESHDRMAHEAGTHMAGLVVGIGVGPRPDTRDPARVKPRRLHLFVQEGVKQGRSPRTLGYVLQREARPPEADSVEVPGSVLVLTRGEPTDIVVVNRLNEPTAIHWHGIELESYSDGVAGWSGAADRLAPAVMPGDSFTARLTLPRSGTFMYHTHLNDVEQLTSGLYGGIVVLEPGKRFDTRRDHLFVLGWDGETRLPTLPRLLVNGDSVAAPLELTAGKVHRLRFINIGPAGLVRFAIYRDTSLVSWRRLAKDGADLPSAQSIQVPSAQLMAVGETYDFEFKPSPGRYRLAAELRGKPLWARVLLVR
jgi:manganese oxidase